MNEQTLPTNFQDLYYFLIDELEVIETLSVQLVPEKIHRNIGNHFVISVGGKDIVIIYNQSDEAYVKINGLFFKFSTTPFAKLIERILS